MRIHLDIDTLILRDLPYEQRYPISAAVEQELLRLFADYGTPPSLAEGGYIPQVSIPALSITADSKPEVIGSLIARQLYQSFSPRSDNPGREGAATNSRAAATGMRREMPGSDPQRGHGKPWRLSRG